MRKKIVGLGVLLSLTVCTKPEIDESERATTYSDWNDTLFELVESNDFASADTLSVWLIEQTREAGDYQELINAKTNTAISYLQRRNVGSSREMLEKSLEIIEDYGTVRQKAYALVQLTNIHAVENRKKEALDAINEAMRLVPEIQHSRTEAAVIATKASVIKESNPSEALKLNFQALDMFLADDNQRNVAISRNNIGLIYHEQEKFQEALEEFEQAMRINRELGNPTELSINYNNVSNTLSYMGRKSAAADTMLKAIEINRQAGVTPRLIQNHYNLAQIYFDVGDYENAYSYFSNGYDESKSINFLPGAMYHSTGLARTALHLERYNEASEYLAESRELGERLGNLRVIGQGWEIETSLMEQTGNFEQALTAMRTEKELSDSLDNIRREREFEEIRTAYEVDLKTAENELLRQDLSYQERLSSIQQLFLGLLAVAVLIIAVFLVLMLRSQRKLKAAYGELEEKNKLITSYNRKLLSLNDELKQLNNDKDQLIGIIVHDLRNPLFGVIGFLDVISETVTDGTERKHLDMARKSAHRLNALINSLLDVHSLEKENDFRDLEEVEVDVIITNSLAGFRSYAKNKQISIHFEKSGLTVETHPPYLTRIVDNLVSNALKFSHPDTAVVVSVHQTDGSFWRLEVSDEGPGISEQDRKKMFQMFGKLSARPTDGEDSTGLGLYAVNMLVERMKGSIRVDSALGKGTRFICEFPNRIIVRKTRSTSKEPKELQSV